MIMGDKQTTSRVLAHLYKTCSFISSKHVQGKEVPTGYFWGTHCIGFINNKSPYEVEDRIHVLTKVEYFKQLTEQAAVVCFASSNKQAPPSQQKTVQIFTRTGNYTSFYYKGMHLDVSHINPIGQQIPIVNSVVGLYKKNGRATVFLHGISCAGKSSVGYLVAKQLKGAFCHTFQPTDPGDKFSSMVQDIREQTDYAPLVVVLEEVDCIVRAVHTKTVPINAKTPTLVKDKSSWSTLLDDMVFYKNIVLILTSNEPKEALDALDTAYLRKGRIDASFAMLEELVLE